MRDEDNRRARVFYGFTALQKEGRLDQSDTGKGAKMKGRGSEVGRGRAAGSGGSTRG